MILPGINASYYGTGNYGANYYGFTYANITGALTGVPSVNLRPLEEVEKAPPTEGPTQEQLRKFPLQAISALLVYYLVILIANSRKREEEIVEEENILLTEEDEEPKNYY